MSTPHGDPYGPNPEADPVQEHVPGPGAWAGGQQGPPGAPQASYGGYPRADAPPGNGFPPGGGYTAAAPTAYLQGARVGFGEAVRGAFGHILTFRGRASRSAFWWFVLLQVIAYLVVGFITNRSSVAGTILDILVGIPLWLAGLSLTVRRLHDANHTGWWWWIGLVPIVGWIVLLVFYLVPGTPGPNRYNFAP
ncbi:MAG: DUF805 domain-containing protein [Streptosporangiaceae bacterium]